MAGIVAKTCTPGVQSQQWKFTRYVWWKWNLDLPIKKRCMVTTLILSCRHCKSYCNHKDCLVCWIWYDVFETLNVNFVNEWIQITISGISYGNECTVYVSFFSDKAQENYEMKNLSSLYWPVPATLELISYIISSMFVA